MDRISSENKKGTTVRIGDNLSRSRESLDGVMNRNREQAELSIRRGQSREEISQRGREVLESNVTVVTTTHPPALHIHHPPAQVVIVSNDNNKTLVCICILLNYLIIYITIVFLKSVIVIKFLISNYF